METQRNEITVKINATMEEIHKIIKEKEYEEIDKFSLDDTYFIPENLDIEKISTREILAKALIIRWIKRDEKILTNNHQDLESKTLYFLATYHPAYTNFLRYQKISRIQNL